MICSDLKIIAILMDLHYIGHKWKPRIFHQLGQDNIENIPVVRLLNTYIIVLPKEFPNLLSPIEKNSWRNLDAIIENFLSNINSKNYEEIVSNLVRNFAIIENRLRGKSTCRMLAKYCWSICRDSHTPYKRQSKRIHFTP
ncbi:hypothetical protein CVS40_11592 [Lucilia cuprina]|nr:hypothetical protein CVS40_11592 [Lucilia cuprina]